VYFVLVQLVGNPECGHICHRFDLVKWPGFCRESVLAEWKNGACVLRAIWKRRNGLFASLRIPLNSAGCSGGNRPLIPIESGYLFRLIRAARSG